MASLHCNLFVHLQQQCNLFFLFVYFCFPFILLIVSCLPRTFHLLTKKNTSWCLKKEDCVICISTSILFNQNDHHQPIKHLFNIIHNFIVKSMVGSEYVSFSKLLFGQQIKWCFSKQVDSVDFKCRKQTQGARFFKSICHLDCFSFISSILMKFFLSPFNYKWIPCKQKNG